jgi:hypothetical protein
MDDHGLRADAGWSAGSSPNASYGQTLLVAFGWYASIVGALAVGTLSVPTEPVRDCSAIFSCMTPIEGLIVVGVFVGAPVLAVLLMVAFLVTALVARRVPSAILAGTLSALISVSVIGVVAAACLGAK